MINSLQEFLKVFKEKAKTTQFELIDKTYEDENNRKVVVLQIRECGSGRCPVEFVADFPVGSIWGATTKLDELNVFTGAVICGADDRLWWNGNCRKELLEITGLTEQDKEIRNKYDS